MHGIVIDVDGLIAEPARMPARGQPVSGRTRRKQTKRSNAAKPPTSPLPPPRSGFVQQIAAGNAGWPFQFRFAVHVLWSRVPELWTFGKMMKRSRKIALAIGVLLVVVIAGLTAAIVLGPPGPNFVCHRLLDGMLEQWMLETTNGVTFPNVEGSSSRSLALLLPYFGASDTNALHDYMYVPGLRSDDPDKLILFYLREPSRRTWHGDMHWFTGPKRWVVLNPRMSMPDSDAGRVVGELCEAISMAEFKDRLRATLDYLKQKGRPGWQAAEQEHMGFLRSIQE